MSWINSALALLLTEPRSTRADNERCFLVQIHRENSIVGFRAQGSQVSGVHRQRISRNPCGVAVSRNSCIINIYYCDWWRCRTPDDIPICVKRKVRVMRKKYSVQSLPHTGNQALLSADPSELPQTKRHKTSDSPMMLCKASAESFLRTPVHRTPKTSVWAVRIVFRV